ncbi:MAG: NfeD family protein [Acidimicrobiia bacterium]
MLRRLFITSIFAFSAILTGLPALAHGDQGIDVVVVSGSLDGRLINFVIDAIEDSDAEVVILQIDSAATLNGDFDELLELVTDPPTPVAIYAGPDPARVSGGALRLLAAAPIAGAAPGVVLGPAVPTRAGASDDSKAIRTAHPDLPEQLVSGSVSVVGDFDGFLDLVEPSIGQFVVGLHDREVMIDGAPVNLETAIAVIGDGVVNLRPSGKVTFIEPGLIDATLRLGSGPEAAFFFLMVGFSLVAFEFYAVGPGAAAAVGVVSLLLGGYGISVLPVRWWAVALIPVGLLLYTVDFQRNDLGWKSLLGTGALISAGLFFTDAAPQIVQTWWIVLIIVLGTAMWFGFALTTIVRSRFSTQTIGRDHLIGRMGTAETAIAPDGTVVVEGAKWQARSTRVSGIEAGDRVEVVAVEGVVLEVDPLSE